MRERRHSPAAAKSERRRYDRRAFPRSPISFEVRYGKGANLQDAQGFEIGTGGLSFLASTLLDMDSEIEVHYRFHKEDSWVKVKAVVKHSEGQKQGAEFLNLRMSDRLRIVDFVSHRK